MTIIQRCSTALIALVFQPHCPLCERSASAALCSACQTQIQTQCYRDRQLFWRSPLPVFPWGQYGGALRQSIAALKYESKPGVAQLLGAWLGRAWLMSAEYAAVKRALSKGARSIAVVPIPMYAEKRQQRGYDQAMLIAQQFCRVTRLPLRQHGLIRKRATVAQFCLSAPEREANLTDAFRVDRSLSNIHGGVLLVDDIYTTGATARAAAEALQRLAIPVLGIVTVAATGAIATSKDSFSATQEI
ncbi:MAG: hypothetical protein WBA10_21910 [Elainellaceae cyanobacterium]